jgi:hypothetical protein
MVHVFSAPRRKRKTHVNSFFVVSFSSLSAIQSFSSHQLHDVTTPFWDMLRALGPGHRAMFLATLVRAVILAAFFSALLLVFHLIFGWSGGCCSGVQVCVLCFLSCVPSLHCVVLPFDGRMAWCMHTPLAEHFLWHDVFIRL